MRRFTPAAVAALAVAATALAPVPAGAAQHRRMHSKLVRFDSCTAVNRYARHHPRALRETSGVYALDVTPTPTAPGTGGPEANTPQGGSTAPTSDAGTNVQEAGVDEPDIVKAEGSTIFAIAGGQLHAVDAGGPDPRLLDSIALPGDASYGYGAQLFVAGDHALVISQRGFYYGGGGGPIPLLYPYGAGDTELVELDISDPGAMKVEQTMRIEGNYVNARLTGHTARVVISSTPEYPAAESQSAGAPSHGGSTMGSSPAATRRSAVHSRGPRWLPTATIHDRSSGDATARPLTPCRDVERPTEFSGLETLSVLTIDLDRGLRPVDSEAVTTSGGIVYASTDSLYVATERWYAENATPDAISDVSTEIHKFDISRPDETAYRASGQVPGFMLSQWSMSEQDGVLRVASTTEPPWTDSGQTAKSQSFVTDLREREGALAQIGQLGGLGTNQRIYAVRFIGDTGYVVTFRQVDPLYVIDVSDPQSPKVTGQLEIPGYSAYLHPLGGGLLLGVGQAATPQGRLIGTQLSVFDVSDAADPKLIAQKLIAQGAHSEVEDDHHAFTFWAPTDLAVLPVDVFDQGSGDQTFNGAIGYRVGNGGIDEVGRASDGTPPDTTAIRRSLVIGDRLYLMSDGAIIAADLGSLAQTGSVALPAVQ